LEILDEDEDAQTLYNKIGHVIKKSMSTKEIKEGKQTNAHKIFTKPAVALRTTENKTKKLPQ
jgi:hypothetical protein